MVVLPVFLFRSAVSHFPHNLRLAEVPRRNHSACRLGVWVRYVSISKHSGPGSMLTLRLCWNVMNKNTTSNASASPRSAPPTAPLLTSSFAHSWALDTPDISTKLLSSVLIFKLRSTKQIPGVVRPRDAIFEYTSVRGRPVSGCIVHRRLALFVF